MNRKNISAAIQAKAGEIVHEFAGAEGRFCLAQFLRDIRIRNVIIQFSVIDILRAEPNCLLHRLNCAGSAS